MELLPEMREKGESMNIQKPMLMESPLTKRVYVVTSYKDNGDGTFTARVKHDVTEQFDALAKQRCDAMDCGECENVGGSYGSHSFKCSECGESLELAEWAFVKFCHNCGKKVRQ